MCRTGAKETQTERISRTSNYTWNGCKGDPNGGRKRLCVWNGCKKETLCVEQLAKGDPERENK